MKRLILIIILANVLNNILIFSQNIECIGNTIKIPLTGYTIGNIQWQFSPDSLNWTNLTNQTSTTLLYTIKESGYFRAKVTYGNCDYFSDKTYVTTYSSPTDANVETKKNIVSLDSVIQLVSNSPTVGKGKWSIVSGGLGVFNNDTLSTTNFIGHSNEIYILQWSITNECITKSDSLRISIYGHVNDIEGNTYKTVKIGNQIWMAENLKTTKYNTGTAITETKYIGDFIAGDPYYCWYNFDSATYKKYGALYNWYTVNTGNLCPSGWHVPSDEEWTNMEKYLLENRFNYDNTTSGNKYAKSLASASGWEPSTVLGAVGNSDCPDKMNATGFNALPAGCLKQGYEYFIKAGMVSDWWSSSERPTGGANSKFMNYDSDTFHSDYDFSESYFSVRCVKDPH